jgi:hypothetical protein
MTLDELSNLITELNVELNIYQYGTRTKAGSKRIRKYLTEIRKNAPALKRELILADKDM